MISLEDVRRAAKTIAGERNVTPVITSRRLNDIVGAEIFLKCENFQRTGSFKFRGAYNKISSLSTEQLRNGVVAYSSGNHSQAVALAASLKNVDAVILMPQDTPRAKMEATLGYGANVVTYDRYSEDRVALGEALARERGITLIPPYDDPLIMAGQGTAALELVEEVRHLDLLLVPVGGGGLISGCATAARGLLPQISVIGVEPEAGDDTKRSLEAGDRVKIGIPRTIADGLQAEIPGRLTFEVVRSLVDDIVVVSDAEIVGAMAFLFEIMKIVAEPSGAATAAALLAKRAAVEGKRVGAIVSGGNVGLDRFRDLFG